MTKHLTFKQKIAQLSPALQAKIVKPIPINPNPYEIVSSFLIRTKRHCTGGATVEAGLWLRDHIEQEAKIVASPGGPPTKFKTKPGGKLVITMAGAGSSFQMGIILGDLMRAEKVSAISVTGANLEESVYRYVAHDKYVYIPSYVELTPEEETELRDFGLRRITDTFLPEEESVRKILPQMTKLLRKAEREGKSYLWHEYFWKLFENNMIHPDKGANPDDCWLLQTLKEGVEVFVPGREDSTMGNIFSHAVYNGEHPILSKYKMGKGAYKKEGPPISNSVVLHPDAYMHRAAEWYLNATEKDSLALWQLGGGIAGDFIICVVPHLLHDYQVPRELVKPWKGFIEIHSSPMVYGSYSGAGWKEKITWDKVDIFSYGKQLFGDYTQIAPDLVALMLRW